MSFASNGLVKRARCSTSVAANAGRRYNCGSGSGIRLLKENRRAREAGGACWRAQAGGSGTNEENAVVISASALSGSCESCPGKPSGYKRERDRDLSTVYYWQ